MKGMLVVVAMLAALTPVGADAVCGPTGCVGNPDGRIEIVVPAGGSASGTTYTYGGGYGTTCGGWACKAHDGINAAYHGVSAVVGMWRMLESLKYPLPPAPAPPAR